MVRFSSQIDKIGINPVIDPPVAVLNAIFVQAGRAKGPIPVRGTINGAEFIQTLVRYQGAWRLYINSSMVKESGSNVGDEVSIEIEYDPRPRKVVMPEHLDAALRKDRKAKAAFEALPPSRRKEIMRYLGSLKTLESIDKNVERIIRHLRGEKTDAQHALMRRKRDA